jgi:hypothetical protein
LKGAGIFKYQSSNKHLINLFFTYLGKTKQDELKGYVTKEDDYKVAFVTLVSIIIHIKCYC